MPHVPRATPGVRIKQARLSMAARLGREVTKQEIADRLGVSDVTVGRWETDQYEPDLAMFRQIGAVFGVSPAWLAFGVPDELPPEQPISPRSARKKPA